MISYAPDFHINEQHAFHEKERESKVSHSLISLSKKGKLLYLKNNLSTLEVSSKSLASKELISFPFKGNGEDGEEPMREGKSSETTHSTIPRKELMRWMQRRCQKGCRISLVFRLFLLSSS